MFLALEKGLKKNLVVGTIYIPGSIDYRGYSIGFTFDILNKKS